VDFFIFLTIQVLFIFGKYIKIKIMKRKLPVNIPDIIIIMLAVTVTGFFTFRIYLKPRNSVQVLIENQNQKWIYPINAEETVKVNGPLGITVVRIHGNEAWVESSPCNNQICVAAGILRRRGEFAACLPNSVLLAIEGNGDESGVDGSAW